MTKTNYKPGSTRHGCTHPLNARRVTSTGSYYCNDGDPTDNILTTLWCAECGEPIESDDPEILVTGDEIKRMDAQPYEDNYPLDKYEYAEIALPEWLLELADEEI